MNIYLAGGLSGNLSPLYTSIVGGGYNLAGNGYHKTDEFLKEADTKMRVFLAGNGYHKTDEFDLQRLVKEVTNFDNFNILESYYMLRNNEAFMNLLMRCNSFLLDSGAFTFMQGTHQGDVDWDEYIEQYADLINRYDVKLFFELDIETIVGMAIVMRGTHMCKSMRGVKNQGMMTVAHLSGVFKEDEKARREFYKLIDMQ